MESPPSPHFSLELENADWRRKNRELEATVSRLQAQLAVKEAEPPTAAETLAALKADIEKTMQLIAPTRPSTPYETTSRFVGLEQAQLWKEKHDKLLEAKANWYKLCRAMKQRLAEVEKGT